MPRTTRTSSVQPYDRDLHFKSFSETQYKCSQGDPFENVGVVWVGQDEQTTRRETEL